MLKMENVILKPLTNEFSAAMFDWINDRELVHFNAPYKPVSEAQHKAWFEEIMKRNDIYFFVIYLKSNEKIIGSCQLHNINYIHRTAELQIRIGETDETGKEYGTEAVQLLLTFAFNDLNLNRVFLNVFSTNKRAICLYEKVGFKKEGQLREAAFINGEYIDLIIMGILKLECKIHKGGSPI